MVAKYTIIWLNYIDNLNKRLQTYGRGALK